MSQETVETHDLGGGALRVQLTEHGATASVEGPRISERLDFDFRHLPDALAGVIPTWKMVPKFELSHRGNDGLDQLFRAAKSVKARAKKRPPGPGLDPDRYEFSELGDRLAAHLVSRCDPKRLSLARRFPDHLRWQVYCAISNDSTGRVAQLATSVPGALAFAVAHLKFGGPASWHTVRAFRDAVVAGVPLKRALQPLLEDWLAVGHRRAQFGDPAWPGRSRRKRVLPDAMQVLSALTPEEQRQTAQRQGLLLRRAAHGVAAVAVWLPPPLRLVPEHVPEKARANARWFRAMKSTVATMCRLPHVPAELQEAFCLYASRHALRFVEAEVPLCAVFEWAVDTGTRLHKEYRVEFAIALSRSRSPERGRAATGFMPRPPPDETLDAPLRLLERQLRAFASRDLSAPPEEPSAEHGLTLEEGPLGRSALRLPTRPVVRTPLEMVSAYHRLTLEEGPLGQSALRLPTRPVVRTPVEELCEQHGLTPEEGPLGQPDLRLPTLPVAWRSGRDSVAPIEWASGLEAESAAMGNCARTYVDRALRGEVTLCHGTVGGRPLTLGVCLEAGERRLLDARGERNRPINDRERAVVEAWCRACSIGAPVARPFGDEHEDPFDALLLDADGLGAARPFDDEDEDPFRVQPPVQFRAPPPDPGPYADDAPF